MKSRIAGDRIHRTEEGWGAFWYAHRTDSGAPVSVWIYDEKALAAAGGQQAFAESAATLVHVRHPSLVAVREVTQEGWVVLDPLVGDPLAERTAAQGLPELALARLMKDVARLLRTYEERGFVHLGLRPDRVLLDHSESARVIDLGERHVPLRAPGAQGCAAPERATRPRSATIAADVYELGRLILGAALGPKAHGVDPDEALLRLRDEHALSTRFAALLRACLARDAEQRPRPLEVLESLDGVVPRTGRIRRRQRETQSLPKGDPQYPYPIATFVQRLRSVERGATAEAATLEQVFLSSLRFLSSVSAAQALPVARAAVSGQAGPLRNESRKLLAFVDERGPTGLARFRKKIAHGHLVAFLHRTTAVLTHASEDLFMPELRSFLESRKTAPLIEELLKMRNDAKHDRAAPALSELRERVRELLAGLIFLDGYPLVALGRASVQSGVYAYDAQVLSGPTFPFERSPVETTTSVESDRVYLVDAARTRMLSLDPFYVCVPCNGPCNESHLYALQDVDKRGATLVPTDPTGASHVKFDPDLVTRLDGLITGGAEDESSARGVRVKRLSISLTPAPSAGEPEVGEGDVFGECKIVRRLDETPRVHVYEAIDLRTGEPVALKLLTQRDAQERLRVSWEATGHARLAHRNIVRVLRSGVAEGQRFLTLELAPGWAVAGKTARDLAALLALERRPLGTNQAVSIAIQVLEALGYLHDRGIVHRDVAPGNVLLFAKGRVKLSDFGVARFPGGGPRRTLLTVGTPEYMAPEQVQGEDEVDGRADLYSVGVVLFELLTGRPPFRKPSRIATMAAHVDERVPSVRSLNPRVSEALDEVIAQALRKKPADRPKNALRLIRLLEIATRGLSDVGALDRDELEASASTVHALPAREDGEDLVQTLDTKANLDDTGSSESSAELVPDESLMGSFGSDTADISSFSDERSADEALSEPGSGMYYLGDDDSPSFVETIPADAVEGVAKTPFGVLIFVVDRRAVPLGIALDQTLTVGRSRERDIRIASPRVSRLHAMISFDQGTLSIRHMGTRHPTLANGVELARGRTFAVPNGALLDFAGTLAWLVVESPPAHPVIFDDPPVADFLKLLAPKLGERLDAARRGGPRAWAELLRELGPEGAELFQRALRP